MQNQFKTRCGSLLLVLVTLLLVACGRETGPDPASLPPVELRVITGEQNSDLVDALVDKLAETYPTMTLKFERWGNWPRAYLTDDEPPDIMTISAGDWVISTIQEGLVADVTDVWEQSNLDEQLPQNLRALTEHQGKQYMLPIGYDWRGIYYNRSVFDQYGLTPPETWDELMQIAETLVINGEYPFSLPGQNEWAAMLWFDYLILRMHGPEYHRALAAGEIPYTDDGVREVISIWAFMFEQSYFIPNTGSVSELNSLTALVRSDTDNPLNRNKAAMVLMDPGEVDELPSVFQTELGFFPFPTVDPSVGRGELVASFGYLVPANSPNRLEALRFLSFAATPEIQEILAQYAGQGSTFVPAHIGDDVDNLSDKVKDGWSIVNAADDITLPIMWSSPSEMRNALERAASAFIRTVERDELDIDIILERLEEERLKLLAEGAFDN